MMNFLFYIPAIRKEAPLLRTWFQKYPTISYPTRLAFPVVKPSKVSPAHLCKLFKSTTKASSFSLCSSFFALCHGNEKRFFFLDFRSPPRSNHNNNRVDNCTLAFRFHCLTKNHPTWHHPPCKFWMWEWCAQLLTGRCHLLRFAKLFFVSLRFSMNLSSLNPLSAALAPPFNPPVAARTAACVCCLSLSPNIHHSHHFWWRNGTHHARRPHVGRHLFCFAHPPKVQFGTSVCVSVRLLTLPGCGGWWGGGQCGVGWWWCLGRRLAATACAPLWLCVCFTHRWGQNNRL